MTYFLKKYKALSTIYWTSLVIELIVEIRGLIKAPSCERKSFDSVSDKINFHKRDEEEKLVSDIRQCSSSLLLTHTCWALERGQSHKVLRVRNLHSHFEKPLPLVAARFSTRSLLNVNSFCGLICQSDVLTCFVIPAPWLREGHYWKQNYPLFSFFRLAHENKKVTRLEKKIASTTLFTDVAFSLADVVKLDSLPLLPLYKKLATIPNLISCLWTFHVVVLVKAHSI